MRHIELFQRELARLEVRLHVLHKMQIRLLGLGVVRMAGHRNVAAARFLVQGALNSHQSSSQRSSSAADLAAAARAAS